MLATLALAADAHLDAESWRIWFAGIGATAVMLLVLAFVGAVSWWRRR